MDSEKLKEKLGDVRDCQDPESWKEIEDEFARLAKDEAHWRRKWSEAMAANADLREDASRNKEDAGVQREKLAEARKERIEAWDARNKAFEEVERLEKHSKEIAGMWEKDTEGWNEFLSKVMFGLCFCEGTLVKRERCAVHGEDAKARKFVEHIRAHLEEGDPVLCKICGKTVEEIAGEEHRVENPPLMGPVESTPGTHSQLPHLDYLKDNPCKFDLSKDPEKAEYPGKFPGLPKVPVETPERKEFREKVATEVTEAVVQDVIDASYEPEKVVIPVEFAEGVVDKHGRQLERRIKSPPEWGKIFEAMGVGGVRPNESVTFEPILQTPPSRFDGLEMYFDLQEGKRPTFVIRHEDPDVLEEFLREAGIDSEEA